MDPIQVSIRRHEGKELVDAVLRDLDPVADLKCWEEQWQPMLRHSNEEDRPWNWSDKYMELQTVNYEFYSLECEEATQGMMVIDTDFHRTRSSNLNLVYVSFLATAPWNRHEIGTPRFRRVGPLLLRHAVVRSEELGYKFRTGLHSLPGSEWFYDELGLESYGPDPDLSNMRYYEFSEATGKAFVEGGR